MKYQSRLSRLSVVSIGSAMADMALLLLIFFMAATTSEPPQGVDVEMPKAVTEGAEQDTIYISVSSDGTVYVEGEKSSLEGLNDFLAMHGAERDKTVSVTADRNLPYKTVREVLETLRSRDFLNVIFMAQPEE